MKRKILLLALATIMLTSTLTACDWFGTTPDESTIVIWANAQYWGGTNEELVNTMLDEYKAQTGKDVIFVPQADLDTQLKGVAQGGEGPDLVFWDRWDSVRYIQENRFVDLTDRMTRDGINPSDYQQQALEELTYNGKYYGLPLDVDMWGIFVNTKMLAEAGISDLPMTWDSFRTAAKAMTIGSGSGMTRAGFLVEPALSFYSWILTAGGKMLNDDATATAYNSPEGKAALEYLWRLRNVDKVYDPSIGATQGGAADDVFLTGKVAMITNSLLNGTSFYNKYKPAGFEFEFIPYPMGPSAEFVASTGKTAGSCAGGLLGGYGLTIPTTSSNVDAAWDLIKWWVTDTDNALRWAQISNLIPAKLDVMERDEVAEIPHVRNVIDSVEHYKIRPALEIYPLLETQVTIPMINDFFALSNLTESNITAQVATLLSNMARDGNELIDFNS